MYGTDVKPEHGGWPEAVWIYLWNSFCFLLPLISLHTSNTVTYCRQLFKYIKNSQR